MNLLLLLIFIPYASPFLFSWIPTIVLSFAIPPPCFCVSISSILTCIENGLLNKNGLLKLIYKQPRINTGFISALAKTPCLSEGFKSQLNKERKENQMQ